MNAVVETIAPPLVEINALVTDVLALLPQMGNLMVIGRKNGVTLERIGPVEHFSTSDNGHLIGGVCHDARLIDTGITQITLNPGREIGGNVYPRMEFKTATGDVIMAVVGMAGGDAFLTPLAGLARTEIGAAPKTDFNFPKENFPVEDPGYAPLDYAYQKQAQIEITYDRDGLVQRWIGVIPSLNPSRGFLNIMTDDFHLHLRIGAVGSWRKKRGIYTALDMDGAPNGLTLRSEVFA